MGGGGLLLCPTTGSYSRLSSIQSGHWAQEPYWAWYLGVGEIWDSPMGLPYIGNLSQGESVTIVTPSSSIVNLYLYYSNCNLQNICCLSEQWNLWLMIDMVTALEVHGFARFLTATISVMSWINVRDGQLYISGLVLHGLEHFTPSVSHYYKQKTAENQMLFMDFVGDLATCLMEQCVSLC